MIDPIVQQFQSDKPGQVLAADAPPSRMGLFTAARYAWGLARTRLLWGRRLHFLGCRTVLGRSQMVQNPMAISIGSHVTLCDGFVFADLAPGIGQYPKITIGDGASILFRFQCNAARSVMIGPNVLIASNVFITDSDHVVAPGGPPVTRNPHFISRPVVIEHNCWIGQNAVILKGVTIGHDSIIGANSVVTRDVKPYSVAVGNPAAVIKSIPNAPTGSPGLNIHDAKEQPWKP